MRKGTPNRLPSKAAAIAAAVAESGLTPLDYMLSTMRDPGAKRHERLEAAAKAAPYCHPRLASVALEHGGNVGVTVNVAGDDAGLL